MKNKRYLYVTPCILLFYLICLFGSSCSLPKDTIIDRQQLETCSNEKVAEFEFVREKMEGLHVSNPTHEDIGYPKAFFDGAKNYYWVPVNGKKMAVCGNYARFSIYDGKDGIWPFGNDSHEDEYDWNLSIVPHADFSYIISQVYNLSGTTEDWVFEEVNGKKYTAFQAEITPDESLYNNDWFPNIGHDNSSYDVVSKTIGVYGPWVMDNNHNNRPEIHPCEVIWWRNRSERQEVYFILGIQDDSNRYDTTNDFVFDQDFGLSWKPWAAGPITSQYKIPFEYNGQFQDHLVVNIEELKAHNVVTPTMANAGDSDDGKQHILRFKSRLANVPQTALTPSNILVEVNENFSNGLNIGVRFVEVCKKPNGNIVGYVQLFTAYGKNVNGQEGYHALKVTVNHPTQKVPGDILRN